jgi:hypothetical protein
MLQCAMLPRLYFRRRHKHRATWQVHPPEGEPPGEPLAETGTTTAQGLHTQSPTGIELAAPPHDSGGETIVCQTV